MYRLSTRTTMASSPALRQLAAGSTRRPQTLLRGSRQTVLQLQNARFYSKELEPDQSRTPSAPRQGNEAKLGRSFQGLVMGSIGARLRRERDQREQYERWRDMTDPSRNWMITFCKQLRDGECRCETPGLANRLALQCFYLV